MAYNESLATRVRAMLARKKNFSERKMFGGIAFMLGGKMCCGVLKDELVARIGPDAYEHALQQSAVRPMDFTGRPMKGYVYVGLRVLRTADQLRKWVDQSVAFTATLNS